MTTTLTPAPAAPHSPERKPRAARSTRGQLSTSLPGAFRKLNPQDMWHNPVMFIVEVGAALTTVLAIALPFLGKSARRRQHRLGRVHLAHHRVALADRALRDLAEAVAEGRGKAQAATLRKTRTTTMANRVDRIRREG